MEGGLDELLTFIDVRKVGVEAHDGFENRRTGCSLDASSFSGARLNNLPIRAIECLDCLGVQVFHCLLVAPADSILGSSIAVKGVDGLCNTHLGRRHSYVATISTPSSCGLMLEARVEKAVVIPLRESR